MTINPSWFQGYDWDTEPFYVRSTVIADDDAKIGGGTRIGHYSHIMAGAKIGKNCTLGQNVFVADGVSIGDDVEIQNNVSVYKGVTLEDNVFCGPSVVFTNDRNPRSEIERDVCRTLVKRGATLGANCTIVCGITIGEYAFVSPGTVATKDVPDFTLTGVLTRWEREPFIE